MNARARVFAGELAKTTLQIRGRRFLSPMIITPGGGACAGIFLCGALTRVAMLPGDLMEVWVADPTGTFFLVPDRQDTTLRETFGAMEPPVFISVIGEVRPVRPGGRTTISVRPVDVKTADRTLRDTWIIRTAEITLERLCMVKSVLEGTIREETAPWHIREAIRHYHTDTGQIAELEAMVLGALSKAGIVPGGEIKAPDPREMILGLIRAGSGPKGIALTDLVPLALEKGIREDQLLAVVRQLVAEDECYQPGAGIIKLL